MINLESKYISIILGQTKLAIGSNIPHYNIDGMSLEISYTVPLT